ncbi:ATP-dependent helicase HrpB [Sphingorhabdus arenilitoris]|uniref:ATP-dependent helicase HrpB n=1 Tax=Sphingorhabdus arenilitoris TaxID=1490041 RepID=A0ABV8RFU8_9SPHN
MSYPVEAVLDELLSVLSAGPNAVLIAPPGAGKTTLVAPAMLQQPWCKGQILLLSPRRIAARMAAERIAEMMGQKIGDTVGYATRMDSKQSAATRLLVLTEGIFRNRIIADPELNGVSAVLFDEVHERSIDSDFGLALALEAQSVFRPDLRIVAMSATLDGDRFSALMGGAPLIRSEGKSWPLQHRYLGRRAEMPIEQDVAAAIRTAMAEEQGDILVFLPGMREIERTAERLSGLDETAAILPLYGNLDPVRQRAALVPDERNRRKVILATNIAETSLTIDGVRIVIDSGLSRRSRFDKAAGISRLVTEKASLSAATQRAGRAARQGPGICYRLWEEAGNGGLPPFDPPEIFESDLTALLLDCASWGESEPANLRWLDPPPAASVAEAKKALAAIKAIDDAGRITEHGRALSLLPLPPHLAHMMLIAAHSGQAEQAAAMALLIQERALGGASDDLDQRYARFVSGRGGRAGAAHKLAARLAALADRALTSGTVEAAGGGDKEPLSLGALIALAFPARLSKRRDANGENWISVMGRGLRLDRNSPLATSDWLAVADLQGAASGARILSATAISQDEVEMLFAAQIQRQNSLRYIRDTDRIEGKSIRRLGAVILAQGPLNSMDDEEAAGLLCDAVREHGLALLPWPADIIKLRRRAAYAGVDIIGDAALLARIDDWLRPIVNGVRRLRDINPVALRAAMDALLGWDGKQQIDAAAPAKFHSPAGTAHDIDYDAEAGPTAELRVQALFGLDIHPKIGRADIPLIFSLTSPAGRPIQTTQDLPAFWRGSWHDVAKEMRGRYPKHNWPEKPWEANASLKTKKAQGRGA